MTTHVEHITPVVKLNLKLWLILKSSLCNYSDAYRHIKGTIRVLNTTAMVEAANNVIVKVILKNFARFIDCITEINNTQVFNIKYISVVIPVSNLIEYIVIYSKTSLSNAGAVFYFYANNSNNNNDNNIVLFKFKVKITG